MICVKINKTTKEIASIWISGHSGYAQAGFDIVCSAVSSVVTTSINAILSFKKTIEVTDDGKILKIFILNHDKITNTLIQNMINHLKEIEKQYKKNIKVEGE